MKNKIIAAVLAVLAISCVTAFTCCTPEHVHSFGEWTEVSPATCTSAGRRVRVCSCKENEEEEIPALGHSLIPVTGKPANCTESGWADYEECLRCDYSTYTAIAPTGHTYSDKWESDGESHWHPATCGHTEEVKDYVPHVWGGTGCTVCGYTLGYTYGLQFDLISGGTAYEVSAGTAEGDIIIPDTYSGLPVTRLKQEGFRDKNGITGLHIGGNVTEIGDRALYGCENLKEVTFPDGLKKVGRYSVAFCPKLTKINLPQGVAGVDFGAFAQCSSLIEITLPFTGDGGNTNVHFGYIFGANRYDDNVQRVPASLQNVIINGAQSIPANAFYGCINIKRIVIPDGVAEIENGAFAGSGIEEAELPAFAVAHMPQTLIKVTVTSGELTAGIFTGYGNLEFAEIGKDVTLVGVNLFNGCVNLKEVVFPENLTYISSRLFYGCSSLEKVVLPQGVTLIGDNAFNGCTSLETLILPDSVEDILDGAFRGCTSLTSINIPDGVANIAINAFSGCTSLSSVAVGNGVKSIGGSAFYGCTALTDITLPESVTDIGSSAFANSGLTGFKFPQGVTKILTGTFSGCSQLESVEIPAAIMSIGATAFADCVKFKSVIVPSSVGSIGRGAFSGCSALEEITLPFVGDKPRTATSYSQYPLGYIFGTNAYEGGAATLQKYYNWNFDQPDGSSTYYIPQTLKRVTVAGGSILNGAFYGCANIVAVTLGAGVTDIQSNAFYGCAGLQSVTFASAEGWSISPDPDGASPTAVNLNGSAANAVYLTDTYLLYFWKKS